MLSKVNNKNTDDNNLIDNNAIYKEISAIYPRHKASLYGRN